MTWQRRSADEESPAPNPGTLDSTRLSGHEKMQEMSILQYSQIYRYMGIDWIPENNNPVITCPLRPDYCDKRFSDDILGDAHGGGLTKIFQCDLRLTDKPYDYEKSIEKLKKDIEDHVRMKQNGEAFEIMNIRAEQRESRTMISRAENAVINHMGLSRAPKEMFETKVLIADLQLAQRKKRCKKSGEP